MHHRDLLVTLELGEEEFDNAYTDCAQYSKVSFWDETYAAETEPFEWYYPYDKFRAVIRSKLQFNDRVLVAGCGNSNILEDMADDGFEQLDGCDFSRIVLDQMRLRCENLPQISFHLESVGDTDFFDESFDGVIDKALFDSMICAEDGPRKVTEYINEVDRILLDTGVFILISHSNPEEVLPYLEQYDIDQPNCSTWIVDVQAVGTLISIGQFCMLRQ